MTPASRLRAEPERQAGGLVDLVALADARGLDRHPRWLALLHYERNAFHPGVTSQAESGSFFLASDGRVNPRNELVATLASFFEPDALVKDVEHPQCAFAARFRWLDEQLSFDRERLPRVACPHLERWRAGLEPAGLSLIFPEAFLNNPASMFGHTLLRIDVASRGAAGDVLAYAVDFSADVGSDGGLVYAMRGIFGIYDGVFAVNPYYEKLRQYGDWQNRDIWEYPLSLSDDELEWIILHLWELRGVVFPYYFFDENCSYHLLRLLEVARPESRMADRFPLYAIPVDTLRVVLDEFGPLRDERVRPSPVEQLRAGLRSLSWRDRRRVWQLSHGRIAIDDPQLEALAPRRRAQLFSLAYDELRVRYLAGKVSDEESRSRSRQLLLARARIGRDAGPEPVVAPPETPETRPDQGHPTWLVALGGGVLDGDPYVDLRLRPAFHGLLDPQGGFVEGAEIRILDTLVRYYPELDRVRLEELVALELVSLSPRDRFFKPLSWKISTGLRTRRFPKRNSNALDAEPVWRTDGGIGLAYQLGPHVLAYGLALATLELGPALDNGNWTLGPGTVVGLELAPGADRWRANGFASISQFALGDTTTWLRTGVEARITLTRHTALVADFAYQQLSGERWLQGGVALNLYF